MLLSRTIHFNAGRSLWRPEWSAEKNRAVYGEEGPHGYGHNYRLEVAVEGEIDRETSMIVKISTATCRTFSAFHRPRKTWPRGSGSGSRSESPVRSGPAASRICV